MKSNHDTNQQAYHKRFVEKAIADEQTISDKLRETDGTLSFGQKIADKVATFGGSWAFILSFLGAMALWIIINVYWYKNQGFDPYPFILLNLVLSCLAGLQAPIIMMSQNRQEEKDRKRAENDYLINLKAEMEIRNLHDKIDFLIEEKMETLLTLHREHQVILEKITKANKID